MVLAWGCFGLTDIVSTTYAAVVTRSSDGQVQATSSLPDWFVLEIPLLGPLAAFLVLFGAGALLEKHRSREHNNMRKQC